MALINKLTAIADAIREKNGETKSYTLDEMPTAISEISGGSGSEISEADIIADFVSGTSDNFRNLELNVSTVSSYAFYFQKNVDTLIIRGLKNLASSNYIFSRSYLKHVELYKSEDVDNIITNTDGRYFEYCSSLESVFIDKLDMGAPNYMFRNCTKLKRVICGSTGLGSDTFDSCTSLEYIDLFNDKGDYIWKAFNGCTNLKHIILRSSNFCEYKNTGSRADPSNEELKIYVPRNLLETYKTATNWSRLADHFVALEDYTDDGTCSGNFVEGGRKIVSSEGSVLTISNVPDITSVAQDGTTLILS